MTDYIRKGWGFTVQQNFARAAEELPCRLSPSEYAKPGHTIAYIKANPESNLGFLKHGDENGEIRIHVKKQALRIATNEHR